MVAQMRRKFKHFFGENRKNLHHFAVAEGLFPQGRLAAIVPGEDVGHPAGQPMPSK